MRRGCFAVCSAFVALLVLPAGASPDGPESEPEHFHVEVRGELRIKEVFIGAASAVTRPNRAPDYEAFTIHVGQRHWNLLMDAKTTQAARKLRGQRVDVSGSLEPEGVRVGRLQEAGGS